jgi:CubicO group peptidase (beta-lactamase class C family)
LPRLATPCLGAALAATLAAGPLPAQEPDRPAAPLAAADVEAFADSFFARYLREFPYPSLAVAVVAGDSVLFLKGYGTEDGQRPVDPSSTVFNIASISKLVVATAAMQLVEQGAVSLDDDIEPRLGGVRLAGSGPKVTLRHLLTHTSGLEGPFLRDVVADPGSLVPLQQYFTAHPPRRGRTPGAEIRYSNYAMALAGYLIEQVSGEPFQDYVERHLFAPLGMTGSSFRQPPPESLAARVATAGAGRVPDALLAYPAGSMVSTPSDMARFLIAHLNGGRAGSQSILPAAGVGVMHARQWSADPRVPGVGLGFFESALGGEPGLFHTGARVHFSLLYLFPERNVGLFVVQALRQGGEFQTLRADFVRAFAARYFPQAPPPDRDDGGAAARARAFAGVYRPHLLATTTIERAIGLVSDTRVRARPGGLLEMTLPAGPTLSLKEAGDGLYRATGGSDDGLMFAFVRDHEGRVLRLSMSGNTQDPVTFDRLAWYQSGTLHAVVLGLVLLLFLGCAAAEILGAVARLVRRRAPDAGPAGARRAWRVAALAGILVGASPLSFAALVLAHQGDDAAADGLRLALRTGCTFLLAGTALGLLLVPLSLRVRRGAYWSAPRRAYFYALATGAVVAAPLLLHYHVLGYWF